MDSFWSGGISNPIEVIEQITYLLFIRRLDDLQTRAKSKTVKGHWFLPRGRSWDLPGDGHENCPVVAMGSAQR